MTGEAAPDVMFDPPFLLKFMKKCDVAFRFYVSYQLRVYLARSPLSSTVNITGPGTPVKVQRGLVGLAKF